MKHDIDLKTAKQLVTNYRNQKEDILAEEYRSKNILPNCETFDRDAIDRVLKLSACKQLRIYYGMNENHQLRLILVGVDENGKDILPGSDASQNSGENDGEEPPIIEEGNICPPNCPPESDLYP